jgi:hypothetical protein
VEYKSDPLSSYQCKDCYRPIPLTPSGRMPRRERCEPCQKAWEYDAWKAKSPDKARALWRNATTTYRRRFKGDGG